MLFSGGRILVAAVGAAVLVVVAVFVVRSAWWDPASKQGPITQLTGAPPPATTATETPGAASTPDISTGGNSAGSVIGDPGGNSSRGNAGTPTGGSSGSPSGSSGS